ncbi:hypothetical protein QE152_g38580 [Popillia japonica]|uniref:DNA-directed DNA polymerase n=1 Tax=Popillia japonica TaxID=7064 RepID=A0AAW1HWN4_POPJA
MCNNKVTKPVDYSKLENILKEFKKEDLHLVLQKGVYPYEWVDSYEKFSEQLPLAIVAVYKHFNCKNFGEYHDLYLKLETILLKDVHDNFRKTCYKNYKLDPVYYISAPDLADAVSLKITGKKLELIQDQKLYEMYENGIRGGISMIPHRHAIANNCYFYDEKTNKTVKLTKEQAEEKGIYNSKKRISYIMYLDCNNLYGYALSQELPIVDLEIPNELHNKFKDYPLLPEHYSPSIDELSNYQKDLINKKNGSINNDRSSISQRNAGTKLINTLKSKTDYIIDYRMLKEDLQSRSETLEQN